MIPKPLLACLAVGWLGISVGYAEARSFQSVGRLKNGVVVEGAQGSNTERDRTIQRRTSHGHAHGALPPDHPPPSDVITNLVDGAAAVDILSGPIAFPVDHRPQQALADPDACNCHCLCPFDAFSIPAVNLAATYDLGTLSVPLATPASAGAESILTPAAAPVAPEGTQEPVSPPASLTTATAPGDAAIIALSSIIAQASGAPQQTASPSSNSGSLVVAQPPPPPEVESPDPVDPATESPVAPAEEPAITTEAAVAEDTPSLATSSVAETPAETTTEIAPENAQTTEAEAPPTSTPEAAVVEDPATTEAPSEQTTDAPKPAAVNFQDEPLYSALTLRLGG
ncbi:hypothetical protein AJ80_07951 [Polytolypa hystricis UAMH7299]|uniref:Uncharacterized protein n=1 Tax=Polytolypa hystricis (strain UAMH7299) TaxID=1447883 RepID=A0A2B7XF18_POLH7|nr:hypothetical protein AJ80_07951 [Polytolypa hystricis UAMH7299]